ncbi:MAG TPA: GAF domain-containing protein, partial [Leptospiraceae bacterium]|nr:GAF domain-containing protein [Leptospiraceae bacterium]
AHDRIQQAVYSLIPESERKKIHLKTGKLLFENSNEKERQDRLFDITNQLNAADDLITDETEKFQLFCLNLSSAIKSKSSTAYTSALSYIGCGYRHYNDDFWNIHYDLCAEFFRVWAEAAYLNSDLEKSVEIISFALGKVKTAADKGELYNLLTVEYTLSAKYGDALETGADALRILGVDLPASDYENALKAEMAKVAAALSGRKIGSLIDLPLMESKEKTVAMKLLNYMVPPAFMTNQPLFLVIAAKMVNISLEFGNTGESSYGYAVYGIVLCQVLLDYKNGYEFGSLAYELSLKLKNEVKKCLACEVLVGHLNHWRKPLKQSQDLTEIGFKAGVNSGEIQFAGYIYLYQAYNRYYEGVNLRQYNEEMEKYLEFTDRTKNTHASDVILGSQLTVSLLSRIKTKSGDYDEASHFLRAKERQSNLFICPYYVMKSQIHFLFQEYEKGLEYAVLAEERSSDVPGVISTAENKFYYALNIIGIMKSGRELNDRDFEKLFSDLERNKLSLKYLSEISPENFLHKVILLDAEKAALEGRNFEAMKLYETAIESAWENGFTQNEAMASELAGMFYLKNGFEDIASLYLMRARSGYLSWGAISKLEKFDRDYSQHLKTQKAVKSVTSSSSNTFDTRFTSSVQLDTGSILKASRSISGEIVLEKLLKKMMEIISENAGAEKAVLLLPKKDKWHIEAESSINAGKIRILESIPLSEYGEIPVSLIQYSVRTRENLVISNASRDPRFSNDEYIIKNEPYSIMCIPLIHQGSLKGIIYLENRLAAGAFSLERVQMLQMFAAQISISIENAQLYKSLEEKVEERTKDLKLAQDELVQSEKMAALGQLVAGVAHEINNPIGAIISSIESISGFFKNKFFAISEAMKDMDSEELEIFRKIVLEFLEKTPDFLTSKEKRQIRKETAADLESKGFEDAYTLADYITDIRMENRIEEIYPLIKSGSPDRLRKLYEIFSMIRGISNIQISASKTAKIVYALKSY